MAEIEWTEEDFEHLAACPWDGAPSAEAEFLYEDDFGCDVVRCPSCGIVYARRRLSAQGLPKYWGDYLSRVHTHDPEAVAKRNVMYQIDYAFSRLYVPSGKVLDVGCGNGSFMDVYEAHGYDAYGVEYGKEAADVAGQHHRVRYGVFSEMDFGAERFDLIIFRGVLQYVPDPKSYLRKAVSLLKPATESTTGGHLFITAQPNMNAFAFRLFQKRFTQPVTGADFIGYHEAALTEYLASLGLRKAGERYFYEETPYADVENDILRVAKAIEEQRAGNPVTGRSPAFWGNMMTLMYEKKGGREE